ncbi:hypothetical protein BD560DRAFT_482363 [Blakeslea trispora]|nr:hypothetical protein BD560DRAFT_482363 [Blakeslea trispora]
MTELSSQISLFSSHLSEQLEALESEYQRWIHYKNDYDALERQLQTLPDTTSRQAMIPIGKLAFMPGQIVHTNEILVLLGDQYYAERSAKQAIEILGRRKEVVLENMRLAEAQLNSFKSKKETLTEVGGTLTPSGQQLNEEGLPIMEIREELPPVIEPVVEKKEEPARQEGLPESVLRARSMMKEADEKINQAEIEDSENKALFDLLRELEEEEEEEEEEGGSLSQIKNKKDPIQMTVKEAVDSYNNDSDFDEDEDDRYDTEVADNMFDRFGDDEEYGLDGVVDQEDFTHYEQEAQVKDDFELSDEEEKSTPKVITKKKVKLAEPKAITPTINETNPEVMIPSEPKAKKLSKFKQAQLEKKMEDKKVEDKKVEAPKKFSKFKLLRQEQKERPSRPLLETKEEEEKVVAPIVVEAPVDAKSSVPVLSSVQEDAIVPEDVDYSQPKVVHDRQIPAVVSSSAATNTTKKVSRFKAERNAKTKQKAVAIEKPKRTVTWGTTTTVRDHDAMSAPSVVSTTDSYSQPIKTEIEPSINKIRSPADIFRVIRQTQQDGYPSLEEDGEDENENQESIMDLNELIQMARETKEPFYRPADGSDSLLPIAQPPVPPVSLMSEIPETAITKSKLDNKVMKGAVMERDIAPVDFEQLEDDMDLREITSNYQQKRQSMLAATGGFSFDMKPEFEVFDEELPLPKKDQRGDDDEEEEEVAPKKMSRFKAARLGMKFNNEESFH